jgi:signal transduction histidine kinase
MRPFSIRHRLLMASVSPLVFLVLTLVGLFWVDRVNDIGDAHRERSLFLIRQVAAASEYGVFSGNLDSLKGIANSVKRQSEVISVHIFDAQGVLMASAGTTRYTGFDELTGAASQTEKRLLGIDTVIEAIVTRQVEIDDLFSSQRIEAPAANGPVIGHVVIQLSRAELTQRERLAMWIALGVAAIGIALGSLLALRLARAVERPVEILSKRIQRIGQGEFESQGDSRPDDPFHDLQVSLDKMATRLSWGRQELEEKVNNATAELRVKKEEAEQATLEKSRFLAAASHDLRQPTHALGLLVSRLHEMPMDASMRGVVATLGGAVHSMQDLLDSLLDLSQLEAGAVPMQLEPVSLDLVLASLADTIRSQAAEKGLRLRIRPTGLWAISDRSILQRIVMNLANNAVRYTPSGTVMLACRSCDDGRNVRIEVRDSGIGIAQEDQTNIFREFFQVGNSQRNRKQGLGLGLNIVQRSVQLLGHTITLSSMPGCGTRFTVTLVRTQPAASFSAGVASLASDSVDDVTGLRILVIEDDDFARDAVSELLMSWGCVVRSAESSVRAHHLIQSEALPDVILCDYRLETHQTGLDVISSLRALAGRDIVACLLSGDTDAGLMDAAAKANLKLLHKPVRAAKLRILLQTIMRQRV